MLEPKELLLFRHAKSSWKDTSCSDHDRDLNPRGRKAAPQMTQWMHERDMLPDVILRSTAKRAQKTAQAVFKHPNAALKLELRPELYMASPRTILQQVRSVSDGFNRVMVVAHNPGLEDLVALLGKQWHRFPTAALGHFSLDINRWQDLHEQSSATLRGVYLPKEVL